MKKILIAFQLIISTLSFCQIIDENFKPQFLRGANFTGVQVLQDDRVLVSGFSNYIISGKVRHNILMLDTEGKLDTTFNLDVKVLGDLYGCKVDGSDNIYIYGKFTDFDGNFVTALYRLDSTGKIDNSFAKINYNQFSISEMFFFKDGKLLVKCINSVNNSYNILLLNADGTINNDFQKKLNLPTAVLDISQTDQIILHDNNMSLIELKLYDDSGNFVKQLTAGLPHGQIIDIEILDNGNIILSMSSNILHLLDNEGNFLHTTNLQELYPSFGSFSEIKELTSNNITVIGNQIFEYNSVNHQVNILNATAFDSPAVRYEKKSNNDLVCIGNFSRFNNTRTNGIVYLKKEFNTYNINQTYQSAIYTNGFVYTVEKDNAENIFIGGSFTKVNEEDYFNLVKLNLNGVINKSFDTRSCIDLGKSIFKINFRQDKLIIGSGFTHNIPFDKVNGLSFIKLDGQFIRNLDFPFIFWGSSIRLINSTSKNEFIAVEGASLKNGNNSSQIIVKYYDFGYEASNYSSLYLKSVGLIHDALINEDDELLLMGHQIEYDDGDTSCIVMINEDGSRKKSFNPSLPKNYRCLSGALNDGHIYACGTIMNGDYSKGGFIVKLDKDGNKTIDFNVSVTSFDSSRTSVKFIMPMSKNRILISGSFDFCNGNRVYHNNAIFDDKGNFISELDFGRYSNELRSYVKVGKDFYVIGELITDFGAIGAVKITNIETITMDEEKDPISIFPNPTTNGFKLNANAEVIQIYNFYGQLLTEYKDYLENTSLNINFDKGIYIVKGMLRNGRSFSELLVKN